MQIGDCVTYVDENGRPHEALLTAIHSPKCVNLIYVSDDSAKVDPYGRQLERASSVTIKGEYTAHGRYFVEK